MKVEISKSLENFIFAHCALHGISASELINRLIRENIVKKQIAVYQKDSTKSEKELIFLVSNIEDIQCMPTSSTVRLLIRDFFSDKVSVNSHNDYSWEWIETPEAAKGEFGGQCARTVCEMTAIYRHTDGSWRHYCHSCMKMINRMNDQNVIELQINQVSAKKIA